ncbi:hypothetical protein EI77_04310 [Prosthecobacter fusiformis]|uniref:Uncharacterized protein n=1 Tax=Prosthecobacter fusiformis TaxID=48464 RepID=A0A4R7RKA3_9BACT|nr:hypothetical protein [Prosthecobacter fusiformis]TDU64126.1 hypothetical protein EI77_04310 [Prosthecobacter fusiformis]
MSTITIPIADDDLAFLHSWTQEQGTTVEEFFSREAHSLRRHLQAPLHPVLQRASGVIHSDIDGVSDHRQHLDDKYR